MASHSNKLVHSVPVTALQNAKGESQIYRNPRAVDNLRSVIHKCPEVTTIQEVLLRSEKLFGDRDFLGTRSRKEDGTAGPYVWKTYKEIVRLATHLGSGILNMDMAPFVNHDVDGAFRFVAVFSKNREEWFLVDAASALYDLTVVPINDTLGEEATKFLFDQTEVSTVFC